MRFAFITVFSGLVCGSRVHVCASVARACPCSHQDERPFRLSPFVCRWARMAASVRRSRNILLNLFLVSSETAFCIASRRRNDGGRRRRRERSPLTPSAERFADQIGCDRLFHLAVHERKMRRRARRGRVESAEREECAFSA